MTAGSRVIFLADAHLARTQEAVRDLVAYLEPHLAAATGLYLLGDVFHYAVGLANFRLPAQDDLLDFMEATARRGIAVGYVGGNRDYFLDDMMRGRTGIAYTEESLDVAPYGVALHLVHGDTVNRDDRQYLRWRRASRSRAARTAFGALPRHAAAWLGDRLERSFGKTNRSYRIRFPEEACRRYAEGAIARGSRLVLMGHFHEPRTIVLAGGALHVLPDWLSRRQHAELHADGTFVLEAP